MTGAIEFLQKAKAIDNPSDKEDVIIAIINYLHGNNNVDQAGLVRKVMEYRLEVSDAEEN